MANFLPNRLYWIYIYIYHYLADIFFVKFLLYMTTTIDQQVTWTWAGQYFYTDVVIFQRIASHTWVPTFDQHPDCAKDPMIIKMLLTSTDMISQLLSIFWPRPTISTPDEWTRYYVSLIGSEGTCRHYYLRFKMVIILLLKSPFHSSEVSIFAAEIPMSSPIHPLITYRFPITLLLEKVTSQFAQKNAPEAFSRGVSLQSWQMVLFHRLRRPLVPSCVPRCRLRPGSAVDQRSSDMKKADLVKRTAKIFGGWCDGRGEWRGRTAEDGAKQWFILW